MFEATPKAAPKKKAHENLMDAIRDLKFPGRLTETEREIAMEELAVQCRARANDIIPEEIVEPLCHDLLVAAVNSDAQMAPSIWQFVVSQLEDEQLAIVMLEEVADDVEEGWVVVQHPSGVHLPMTADHYNQELAPGLEIVGMLMNLGRMIPGLGRELPEIGGQIIARVGPQPEVEEETPSACGCVCAECEARAAGCPIPEAIREAGGCGREIPGAGIPDFDELEPPDIMDSPEGRVATGDPEPTQDSGQTETAEVEEPPAAEADDTPAKEEAVPAASD